MLGMNDAGYQPLDSAKLRKFSHDYKYFLRKIRALLPHADIWLLQSTPFDDITRPLLFPGGYNSVLRKYGSSVGVIAKKYKVNTIDLNTPVTQVLNCAAKRDPEAAMDIIVDRFHPGNGGHWIVAAKILRAWKFQPIILETRLNWKLKSVSGRNSLVTDWVGNRFKIKEKTLPSPVPDREAGTQLALSCSPDIKWLSKELLKIEQLPLGSYRLDLDGQNIGKFSAQQFSKGIELHRLDTPMMAQARKVLELTERIAAHYGIRKLVIGPNDLPIDQLKSQRRLLAQTQWHSFELIYTGP
jgi:hypothetical protein